MKQIPLEVIDQHWDQLNHLNEEQTRALGLRMQEEQPYVLVYLLAAQDAGEEESDSDEGRVMELGAVIWHIMSTVRPGLRQVTDRDLDGAEAANVRFLEQLDAGPEVRFEQASASLFASYNQMPLLGAVLEALMADQEETPELADDNVGIDLLHLKTVIDCLDQ